MNNMTREYINRHVHFSIRGEYGSAAALIGTREVDVKDFKFDDPVTQKCQDVLKDHGYDNVAVRRMNGTDNMLEVLNGKEQIATMSLNLSLDENVYLNPDFTDDELKQIDPSYDPEDPEDWVAIVVDGHYAHDDVYEDITLDDFVNDNPDFRRIDDVAEKMETGRSFDPDNLGSYMTTVMLEQIPWLKEDGTVEYAGYPNGNHGYCTTNFTISNLHDFPEEFIRQAQEMAVNGVDYHDGHEPFKYFGDKSDSVTVEMGPDDTNDVNFLIDGKVIGTANVQLFPDMVFANMPLYNGKMVGDLSPFNDVTWGDIKELAQAAQQDVENDFSSGIDGIQGPDDGLSQ